jgi:AAA15 family ATPase/GTPase
VYTIVGLNESGKTTILEAINNIDVRYDLSKADPSRTFRSLKDYHNFIPVSQRYNFNGKIELQATVSMSPQEQETVIKFIEADLNLKLIKLDPVFTITRAFEFIDSKCTKAKTLWSLVPDVKKKKGQKTFSLDSSSKHNAEWQRLAAFVRSMLPHVLYFKNEVFDFPDRINISAPEKEKSGASVNKFYCDVLQDILFAIDPKLNLETHLISRKNANTDAENKNLEGLLKRMGFHITQTVMKQWEVIFGRALRNKRIEVACEKDEKSHIFIKMRLEDGGELFEINERSTGFRWFFVFILLTHYRGFRNTSALFLYDEPASNLHSAAQRQLLECFKRLTPKFTALYSTHSHYLINPEWLDNTFIVRNEALEDEDSLESLGAAKTDIKLLPYRQFVSKYPSGVSYFQPILDVIKYVPSDLEIVKPALLVEGKSDFYTLALLAKVCLKLKLRFEFMPCMGSGTVDQLIALYAGWGKRFVVLLDSDKAGRDEKARYQKKFGSLVDGRLVSYGDINEKWASFGIEKVIGKTDLLSIQSLKFPDEPYKKAQFHLAVQELLATSTSFPVSTELAGAVRAVVDHVDHLL